MINRCRAIARLLTWFGAAAIVVLSVVPAADRPVTGAGYRFEHLAAFALVGGFFAVGYRLSLGARFVTAFLFCSGVELLQVPLPTRHARLSDFAIDLVTSWFVIAVVVGVEKLIAGDRRRNG